MFALLAHVVFALPGELSLSLNPGFLVFLPFRLSLPTPPGESEKVAVWCRAAHVLKPQQREKGEKTASGLQISI